MTFVFHCQIIIPIISILFQSVAWISNFFCGQQQEIGKSAENLTSNFPSSSFCFYFKIGRGTSSGIFLSFNRSWKIIILNICFLLLLVWHTFNFSYLFFIERFSFIFSKKVYFFRPAWYHFFYFKYKTTE